MPDDTVEIYTDADSQQLNDVIKIGGRPLPLGSATVKFRMRYALSANLKVDGNANVDDAPKGKVSYDWLDIDIDDPTEYFGWWHVTDADGDLDTREFPIIVMEHSPGIRTRTGAIYRSARSIIPITWNALENSPEYGDSLLQQRIEAVKLTIFGVPVPVEDEIDYDIRVIEFIAKVACLQVIPAGVDYWLAQHQSFIVQGTQESASYPDRIAALWKIYERLQLQIAADKPLIEDVLDVHGTARALTDIPEVSPGAEDGFKSPLPIKHFPDYHFPKIEDNTF